MDAIVGMFPDISMVIFQASIQLSGFSKVGTQIWTDIGTEAWKAKDSGNFNT